MSVVVDTSVLIDVLRQTPGAREALRSAVSDEPPHSSTVVRAEVLIGMRPKEEEETRKLLDGLLWLPVDEAVAEEAGQLGRRWRKSHSGVDASDFIVAATANILRLPILTRNVKHFPMFPDLKAPY